MNAQRQRQVNTKGSHFDVFIQLANDTTKPKHCYHKIKLRN